MYDYRQSGLAKNRFGGGFFARAPAPGGVAQAPPGKSLVRPGKVEQTTASKFSVYI